MARTAIPLSRAIAAPPEPRDAKGRCACGAVHFIARIDVEVALTRCICPRCRGAELRVAWGPREAFRLLTGAEDLTEPLSDPRNPNHFFCARCGEPVFGFAPAAPDRVSLSLACLARETTTDIATND